MLLNLLVLLLDVRLEVLSFINECCFLALLPLDLLPIVSLFVRVIALLPLSMDAHRQFLSTLFTVHCSLFLVT
jgi:hypothetical protein